MSRPTLEVADIIRQAGKRFVERNRAHLAWPHLKVLRAIERCRTAALGAHLDRCSHCSHRAISYNSCRNRHCPKCQTHAPDRWLAARSQELLPVEYFHVVFTLPHAEPSHSLRGSGRRTCSRPEPLGIGEKQFPLADPCAAKSFPPKIRCGF